MGFPNCGMRWGKQLATRWMRVWIVFIILVGLCPLPVLQAAADDWLSRPVEELRAAAENGDAVAQMVLAQSFLLGRAVPKDFTSAAAWFRLAADQNMPQAQFALALMYDSGEGVERDPAEAAKLYRAAAERGMAEAQYNLGVCYARGEGVGRDPVEALKWYRAAADKGHILGQTRVGLAHRDGFGTTQDGAEAAIWLRRAAYRDEPVAKFSLGELYRDGIGVERSFPEAVKWFRRAAEQGYVEAMHHLAVALLTGGLAGADSQEAVKWLQQAAASEFLPSQLLLGQCYLLGEGVRVNGPEAVKWFTQAAEKGDLEAQTRLGLALRGRPGVKRDLEKSAEWLEKAAAQGYPAALQALQQPIPPEPEIAIVESESEPPAAKGINGMAAAEGGTNLAAAGNAPGKRVADDTNLAAMVQAPAGGPPLSIPSPLAISSSARPPDAREFPMGWIAAIFLLATLLILCGVLLLVVLKGRLASLENEILSTKSELTRANVSLATMVDMVEQRLAERSQPLIASEVSAQLARQVAGLIAQASNEREFKARRKPQA